MVAEVVTEEVVAGDEEEGGEVRIMGMAKVGEAMITTKAMDMTTTRAMATAIMTTAITTIKDTVKTGEATKVTTAGKAVTEDMEITTREAKVMITVDGDMATTIKEMNKSGRFRVRW